MNAKLGIYLFPSCQYTCSQLLFNMICWIKYQACVGMNKIWSVFLLNSFFFWPACIIKLCKWPCCVVLPRRCCFFFCKFPLLFVMQTQLCTKLQTQPITITVWACCRAMSWPKLLSRRTRQYLQQTDSVMHFRSHDSCRLPAQLPPVLFNICAGVLGYSISFLSSLI